MNANASGPKQVISILIIQHEFFTKYSVEYNTW